MTDLKAVAKDASERVAKNAAAPAPATARGGEALRETIALVIRQSGIDRGWARPGDVEKVADAILAALASQPQATGGAVEREVLAKVEFILTDPVPGYSARIAKAREFISERLAALATQPAPSLGGWRTDFENAPTDGSVFLVGYDDETAKKAGLFANKDRVYEARWNETQSTWSARNGFILHSDATHWQPLPAAPSIQKGDEG